MIDFLRCDAGCGWARLLAAMAMVIVMPLLADASDTPAAVDAAFGTTGGPDGVVRTVLVEPDGRILIAGAFSTFGTTSRRSVARLTELGELDPGFQTSGLAGTVMAIARRSDGKIVLGGGFTTASGTSAVVAHLNADGSFGAMPQAEANGHAWSLALQPDGKVLMGGDFTFVDGVPMSFLARLNAGGDLDASFGQNLSINGSLRSVKVLENGQILIGGNFTSVNGVERNRIARLHGDGSLDPSFNPGRGADSWVSTLAVQSDGRVLLGGSFLSVDGVRRSRIARLTGNGALDSTFDPGLGVDEAVTSIAIQADGKVIAAGGFTAADGLPRQRLVRFYSNGEVDPFFDSTQAADDWIESLAIQPDGGIVIAGNFTTTNQLLRTRIARLQGGDPAPSPPAIGAAPSNTTINAGSELVLGASARALPQPTYRWFLNDVEIVGATRDTLRLHDVGSAQQGAYRVEVTNPLGVANAPIASVTVVPAPRDPGTPDVAFYSGTGPNGAVHALAVQADEKVLIGGSFSSVDRLPRGGLARFEPNGALDTTFQASAFGLIRSLVVRPNGKILAGGLFTAGNSGLVLAAQFNSDGSVDPAFQSISTPTNSGSVLDMLVLPDDKLLVAGAFTLPSGQGPRATPLARLHANGTVDPAFHLAFSPSAVVYALAREPDNQVILGGFFISVGGFQRNNLARINQDGTVDQTFDPGVGPNGSIRAVAVQADGKLIVAGRFTRIGSEGRTRVARLTSNGALDQSFDAGPFPSADDITALALQGDGKVLIGSSFDDGTFAIARLHSDGSLDGAFRTVALPAHPSRGPAGSVEDIEVLRDGRILVGGDFGTVSTIPRPRVARLLGGDPPLAPPLLMHSPTDRSVFAGRDVTFDVVASCAGTPTYQWQFEGMDLPGETRSFLTLRNARYGHGGRYTVVVRNAAGSATSAPARLNILQPPLNAGAPDIGFYSGLGPNERVHAVAIQADRKVLIAGAFTEVDGRSRNRIARLNRDGSLDLSFAPGSGADNTILSMALQSDGKILIAGSFLNFNGAPRSRLARLHLDGTLDQTFVGMANQPVTALLVQPDGAVVIGGSFTSVGLPRAGLARLTVDGAPDPTFVGSPPLDALTAMALQTDGRLLAAGSFSNLPNIVRLLPGGALDPSFNPGQGTWNLVAAIAPTPDGQIVIGGNFTIVASVTRFLARLSGTGALTGFAPTLDGGATVVVLQPNAQMLVGGTFTTVDNRPSLRLARLNSDGRWDGSFNVGEGFAEGTAVIDEYGEYGDILKHAAVLAIAREGEDSAIIGGNYTTVNGASRPYVARVFLRDGTTIDNDADSLPDWWELQYGLDAYSAAGADGAGDHDGDGHSNRIEFINGTNPVRGDSVEPHIAVTETSPGVFTLQFVTLRDRLYRIHFSPDLQQPFAAITPAIAGTGGMVSWTDDGTQTGGNPMPKRFYKLKVELTPPAP